MKNEECLAEDIRGKRGAVGNCAYEEENAGNCAHEEEKMKTSLAERRKAREGMRKKRKRKIKKLCDG